MSTLGLVGFNPTDEQIVDAMEYMAETGHTSIFIAVDFPGKTPGLWQEGQTRKAVMDRGLPAIWTDLRSAQVSFDTGTCGNTMFQVHADGHAFLVLEV